MKKKAHKTRRQVQAEKAAVASRLIQRANALENPLNTLEKFHIYSSKEGASVEIKCCRVKDLPPETLKWVFDLMERNMKTMYEQSNWGWDEQSKQAELTEETAWYLIASCEEKMAGFSHFRFTLDERVQVLYCYELQLEPSERRKGLGWFIMQALEAIAVETQMQKVVLTVLKINLAALSFFSKLGYKVDITNPPPSEEVDYIIFSKQH